MLSPLHRFIDTKKLSLSVKGNEAHVFMSASEISGASCIFMFHWAINQTIQFLCCRLDKNRIFPSLSMSLSVSTIQPTLNNPPSTQTIHEILDSRSILIISTKELKFNFIEVKLKRDFTTFPILWKAFKRNVCRQGHESD